MRPHFRRALSDAARALALGPLAALLVTTGASALPPPDGLPPAAEVKAEKKAPMPYGQGLLWKIEREGLKPSYLFGTIHVAYEEIIALPEPVKRAFDQASSASFEIEMDDDSSARWAMASYYFDWKTLDTEIGPELYADLVELAEPYGLTIHQLRKFKPWVVIFNLSSPPGVYTSREWGEKHLDQWLYDEALEQDKKVYGLESIAEHVGVFADLPFDVQIEVLEAMVRQDRVALRDRMSSAHERMIQLYLERNVAGMFELDDSMASGAGEEIEAMIEERLLPRRNHLMVERMQPRLKEGKAFVAVGAAHLPGEEGMVNLLVQQGYKVTRVY